MSLVAERIAFGYPGRPVGRDVSLTVARGSVTVLLGPNGCGKTTLFRTLLGLLPAQGGAVFVDGARLAALTRRQAARRIGYVPQAFAGYFPFTIRDTVLMGRAVHLGTFSTPGARDREAAEKAMEAMGIAGIADQPYTRVSGGQRQLALIARALAQEAPYLVMDEPTASLDLCNRARVLGLIRRLADRGIGIVLSTHEPDHAFACGDQVALMAEGSLVGCGSPAETITPAALRRVYGVPVEVLPVPGRAGRSVCIPAEEGL
ncbi:ABC transporter ATP-binding protein [Arenibaculum pallidiluteum]|uniref:ABC transporter ATP-binding protein n=1 Tax=Arenibaculum pallidiluteum TaxID=2812559 RepID=UPI001A96DE67|nr:ABC transporter ATP-binding protein [Arenibaculum pallidiluteum]